jgi:hypothetical protein
LIIAVSLLPGVSILLHGVPSASTRSSLISLLTQQASAKQVSLTPIVQERERASSSFSSSS